EEIVGIGAQGRDHTCALEDHPRVGFLDDLGGEILLLPLDRARAVDLRIEQGVRHAQIALARMHVIIADVIGETLVALAEFRRGAGGARVMRDVADLFAVHKDAAIVVERFEKLLSGAYRHVRPLERCSSPPAASPRCFPACPHPNPPPQAGEGVRGEAEDGWGLEGVTGCENLSSAATRSARVRALSSPPGAATAGSSARCNSSAARPADRCACPSRRTPGCSRPPPSIATRARNPCRRAIRRFPAAISRNFPS